MGGVVGNGHACVLRAICEVRLLVDAGLLPMIKNQNEWLILNVT